MDGLLRTVLDDRHQKWGAVPVDFGGWRMPLHYRGGIVAEHLAIRSGAGLFDVSHMGRFALRGAGSLPFLRRLCTNDAAVLVPGAGQYTLIPNESGGALDDAYLYRRRDESYLLVVNAANRKRDWRHLQAVAADVSDLTLEDCTGSLAMLSLQGPRSESILRGLAEGGSLPDRKNALDEIVIAGMPLPLSRTGYTGEPLGFECFPSAADAGRIWDRLLASGAAPAGLGARDTLRLEAALPLYGHELGQDPSGTEIPIFACVPARSAVRFSPERGDFPGREILAAQRAALLRIQMGDDPSRTVLPRVVMPFALRGRGVARAGHRVFRDGREAGVVTSGTMVPYWRSENGGTTARFTGESALRAIGLMLVDSDLKPGDGVTIEIRGVPIAARVVARHLRSDRSPRVVADRPPGD